MNTTLERALQKEPNVWKCIPCGWQNIASRFCIFCGRRKEDATDKSLWDVFLRPEGKDRVIGDIY